MVAVDRFHSLIPRPWARISQVPATSRITVRIHRINHPPKVERSKVSLPDQTLAIFRLLEILGPIEADWSNQLRGGKIDIVEIGVEDRNPRQVGSRKLRALERSTGQIGVPE